MIRTSERDAEQTRRELSVVIIHAFRKQLIEGKLTSFGYEVAQETPSGPMRQHLTAVGPIDLDHLVEAIIEALT